MNILLFGVENVGKKSIGKKLAQLLNYDFYDLSQEIKKESNQTLENYCNSFVDDYKYHSAKIKLLNSLIKKSVNSIIAVSPINYQELLTPYINNENILPIVLKDTPEHIFDRIVFYDENDEPFKDEEYKNKHKQHYLDEILQDIYDYSHIYENIPSAFFIDNHPIEECANVLYKLIKNNQPIEYTVDIINIFDEMLTTTAFKTCMYDLISGRKIYLNLNDLRDASYNDMMDIVLNDDIYVPIPTLDDVLDMSFYEDFLNTLSDEKIKKELLLKFEDIERDFQEDLEEYGLLDTWLDYEYHKNIEMAKNWCNDNNIKYEFR
ncbi:MAG: shikimate kinase [Thomasclavelia sp.]